MCTSSTTLGVTGVARKLPPTLSTVSPYCVSVSVCPATVTVLESYPHESYPPVFIKLPPCLESYPLESYLLESYPPALKTTG